MSNAVAYVIPFVVLFILFGGVASWVLILKRLQKTLWKKRKSTPSSTELRQRRIPVIESTEFWVPGRAGDIVGIEIQPSPDTIMPIKYSTPKAQRFKVVCDLKSLKKKFSTFHLWP